MGIRIVSVTFLLVSVFVTSLRAQEKGWEKEWNAVIEGAKKEGKVVIRGPTNAAARREIPAAFRSRFGVAVEYLTGRTHELIARLIFERRARHYTVDVLMAGLEPLAQLLSTEKILAPIRPVLILPEVLDSSKWKSGKLWFMDPEDKYILRLINYRVGVLYLNTSQVKRGEIERMRDLLNPKWKGRISTGDPTIPGAGSLGPVLLYREFGEEFVKKLYFDQKATISRESRQLTDWLVHARYPISLGAGDDEVEQMRQEGFPVTKIYSLADFPGRVSGASGLVGLVNPSPHPNAARLFINWIASREGLEIFSRATRYATTRNDVDESFLLPDQLPRAGASYFDAYGWQFRTTDYLHAIERMKEILKK